jgi:ribosome modulation factor
MRRATIFFKSLLYAPIKKIAIENPIQHGHSGIEGYSQTIQPYEFGHTTSKRTCLWLNGLPNLKPTHVIPKEQRTQDIWLASPGPDRWKIRSKTFQGIADAMADQWSKLL